MVTHLRPGFAIWFTGLPSAGKTTLAHAVQERLAVRHISVELLDSDELRCRLVPNPTYTPAEREWFYDLVTFLAELLTRNGIDVLIAATAQRHVYRDMARAKIGRFAEVYVDCPPAVCRARDPKGLWAMVERGQIQDLPGADAIYEAPISPEVIVRSDLQPPGEAADKVVATLDQRGFWA